MEVPVRKVVEGKGRLEDRAGAICGSLAVAVPAAEPAPAVELATEGVRDLVPSVGPVPVVARVVELVRGLDREAAPALGAERDLVAEPDQVVEPGQDAEQVVEAVPT